MFGRNRQGNANVGPSGDEDYYRAVAQARQLADTYAANAPSTYPSGGAFPAKELMYGLADNMAWLAAAGHADRDWQAQTLLIAGLAEAAKPADQVDLESFVGITGVLMRVRLDLEQAQRTDQASNMLKASLALHRFREESGFNESMAKRIADEGVPRVD